MTSETDAIAIYDRYQEQKTQTQAAVHSLFEKAFGQLSNNAATWFKHFEFIIKTQSDELCILREMEAHVRNETMSQEIWNRLSTEADTFRKQFIPENSNDGNAEPPTPTT